MNKRWGYLLLLGGLCGFAGAQTQVSLRTQAKSADLSAVGPTKPMQTGAVLTATCGTGEMFFLTSAAAGSNLYTCASTNVWTEVVSLASVTQGTGTIVNTSGSSINVAVDPAVIPTKAVVQASTSNICTPTSSSGATVTCTMSPTLTAYSNGMLVEFTWNVACTGTETLAIDGLAATNLYEGDGATILKTTDCASGQGTSGAGQTNVFSYDGTRSVFKLVGGGLSSGATLPASAHVVGSNGSGQGVAATAADTSALNYAAGAGTAQAQTVTLTPAITSLVAGLKVCWLPTAANTAAAPTLAMNGLTAKNVTKLGATALVANDLTTSAVACAIYDGTQFELQNPQTASAGSGQTTPNSNYWVGWPLGRQFAADNANLAPGLTPEGFVFTPSEPETIGSISAVCLNGTASTGKEIIGLYTLAGTTATKVAEGGAAACTASDTYEHITWSGGGTQSLTQGTTYALIFCATDSTVNFAAVNLNDMYGVTGGATFYTDSTGNNPGTFYLATNCNFSNSAGSIMPSTGTVTVSNLNTVPIVAFRKN